MRFVTYLAALQLRGKARMLSLYGLLSGPSKIKDLQPVLHHFVKELQQMDAGIKVWDAFREEVFTVRGRLFCTVHDNRGSRDVLMQAAQARHQLQLSVATRPS